MHGYFEYHVLGMQARWLEYQLSITYMTRASKNLPPPSDILSSLLHPKKYGQCDYMNPSRRQAIQQPTTSVWRRVAIGVIKEHILLQMLRHDGKWFTVSKLYFRSHILGNKQNRCILQQIGEYLIYYNQIWIVYEMVSLSGPLADFGNPRAGKPRGNWRLLSCQNAKIWNIQNIF